MQTSKLFLIRWETLKEIWISCNTKCTVGAAVRFATYNTDDTTEEVYVHIQVWLNFSIWLVAHVW